MTASLDALDILSLCTAIGALACLLWVLPRPSDGPAPDPRPLWSLTGLCLALLTFTTAAMLIQRAHVLSGQSYSALTPVLPEVWHYTHYGHVWLVRAGAVAASWLVWSLGRARVAKRPWAVVLLVALSVTAFTRSATGHSADQGDFTAREFMDWLHIVAGSLWAGAVVASSLTLFRADEQGTAQGLSSAARRLSRLATVAFVAVLATGLYNAAAQLDGLPSLWRTAYGRHLALKASLVAVMLGLGAVNRFRYLDRPPGRAAESRGSTTMRRFIRVLYIEAAVALGVFVSAAVLINTAPPHTG